MCQGSNTCRHCQKFCSVLIRHVSLREWLALQLEVALARSAPRCQEAAKCKCGGVDVDSADSPVRFDWKSMVLSHPEAAKIIGSGIIKKEARFMDSHDPNWKIRMRTFHCRVAWTSLRGEAAAHSVASIQTRIPGARHVWAISVRGQRNPSSGH